MARNPQEAPMAGDLRDLPADLATSDPERVRFPLVVKVHQAGRGTRERCSECHELIGNYHAQGCPVADPPAAVGAPRDLDGMP